jgi:hypothetical protein
VADAARAYNCRVSRVARVGLLALSAASALAGCDWGGDAGSKESSSGAQTTVEAPAIESSLEGLDVLPARIRWSVTTSLPSEQVQAVYFFVDRDRWWADSVAPFTFGPEGAFLATRWLSGPKAGRTHEFKVRVVAKNGERWSKVLLARTPAAQIAPGAPGSRHFGS